MAWAGYGKFGWNNCVEEEWRLGTHVFHLMAFILQSAPQTQLDLAIGYTATYDEQPAAILPQHHIKAHGQTEATYTSIDPKCDL